MKKSSKVFCLLFAMLLLFTLSVTVFAGNETNDANISIQVATDKADYKVTGVAEITATITNVSGEDIENITAQAVFDDLAPAGKRTSETSKSVDVLKSGESFSFTYKATLDKDEYNFNIFEKVFLWIIRLFNGGYTVNNNNIDVIAENITEIDFGKYTAENVIQVGYEENSLYTEKLFADMNKVSEDISEIICSEEYKNLTLKGKKKKVEKKLNELEKDGYIIENSVTYYPDSNQFYFEYGNGYPYIIDLSLGNDLVAGSSSEHEVKSRNVDIYELSYINQIDTAETTNNSFENQKAIIMYGWDSCGGVAEDTKANAYFINEYEEVRADWNKKGLNTTVKVNTSVEMYKTALKGYDLIVIGEHGVTNPNANEKGFVVKEKISKEKDKDYISDLDEERIIKVNELYALTPEFFSFYYDNNKLDETIVFFRQL